MAKEQPPEEATLVREVVQLTGNHCIECGVCLCGHQIVINVILGLKTTLRCLDCNARRLNHPCRQLRDHLFQYVRRRDCYRQAWESEKDCGTNPYNRLPTCLWQTDEASDATGEACIASPTPEKNVPADEEWDAGEMACGDLLLALRIRLQRMAPESVLKVIARDPSAPEDVPAWCRLTGHRLLSASHPEYVIERKRG